MLQRVKRQHIEIIFFISYFIVLPIITRLQYSSFFKQSISSSIVYYILAGLINIIIYLIYYKMILPEFLFLKKYLWFFLALAIFILSSTEAFHLGDLLINWLLKDMLFLPKEIRIAASQAAAVSPFQSISISIAVYNLLSLTALGYFIKTLKDERVNNLIKQSHLKLELDNLKAQLQPHFFFNTLNSIYAQALYSSKDTPYTVSKLSELMRYFLYECDQEKVLLKQEIDFIKNYIELEQLRHHGNVKISLELQGKMDDIFISPFLLMPLIENAFKHGINNYMYNSSLNVIISVADNEFIATVKNTKPSFHDTDKKSTKGIGLQNLKKRLSLLYPEKFSLNLYETEIDFEACLILALK